MFEKYLYDIIALLIISTVIIIFFLTRKFKTKDVHHLDKVVTPVYDEYDTQDEIVEIKQEEKIQSIKETQTIEKKDVQEPLILRGEEEGSFVNLKENQYEKPQQVKQTPKKFRQKIKVPEHGKIYKNNFKEFAGVKILIAEDNIINQKVLNGLLSDSGIDITMAEDGQVALDILAKNSDFDIVLMDAHMPRVDGFEATRQIRANENYEHIVVVALSGDTAADDIKKMTESGMQEHLEKPLKMDALYDVLYAYTKSDSTSKDSEFIEVIMTKELNGDQGLSICGGDDEFYREILNEFTLNYANSSKVISELLQNKDIKKADAILLDFIGVTANIGAQNIREIALELKESIKDIEENSYQTILDEYELHLKILLQDIKDYQSL